MRAMPAAVALLLAWTLFAFGGVYDWALGPSLTVALAGAVAVRALGLRHASPLDRWLVIVIAAALLPFVPIPPSLRELLSPAHADYWARTVLAPPAADAWVPLALATNNWLFGAGALIAGVCTFWWTRDALDAAGVRRLARLIAWMAATVSAFALIQPALFGPDLVYGFWKPLSAGAEPAGPIISRNHFAAWVVLAAPLTLGYLITHGRTHWQDRRTSRAVAVLSDTRAFWLVLAVALMTGALIWARSRAGAASLAVALVTLLMLTWRRISPAGRIGLVAVGVLVGVGVSLWASADPLLIRFERAYSGADGGRPAIWAETLTLVRAFPLSGVGLGAFELVMPAYQTAAFSVLINHAHNQYLHLLAEGGLLLMVPLLGATLVFFAQARRRLRTDGSPMVHVRHGALAGLCGLAAMSVVEAPLLTPAVLLLAAVAAALVVRGRDGDDLQRVDA